MAANENRYKDAAMGFLGMTTPVYIGFFIVLGIIRYFGFDDFSNNQLLISVAHLVVFQAVYWLSLNTGRVVSKQHMILMLWMMVCNNIVLCSYWLVVLDVARPYVYIIAPMSTVSLFSVARFWQSVSFNAVQCTAFVVCAYFSEYTIDSENVLQNVGLDWVYIGIYMVVSIWLAKISQTHTLLKQQRDSVVKKFRDIATSAVNSSVVSDSVESLNNSGRRLHAISNDQKSALDLLATASDELRASSEQNAQLANTTLMAIRKTEEHINNSQREMSDLVHSVEEVKDSGEEIQAINNLINEISYQTNILSLNAMIEASRSGDDGGGFKVVALEVKKLAERSANAAADINTLLEKNAKSIDKGVDLSNTMQQRYQVITEEIKPLSLSIKQVSDSSFEQTRAIRQISDGLQDIDKSAQESRSLAIETSQMAADLQSNSQQLLAAMNSMKE